MKREILIMAGTAATLATVMVGCSHSDKAISVGNAAVAPAGASNTKVLVDGKDQNVKGQVACTKAAGTVNIAIGGAGRPGRPQASAPCCRTPLRRSSNLLRWAMSTA